MMIPNLVFSPVEPNDYLGSPSSIRFRKNIWRDISQLHEMFTEYGCTEPAISTKQVTTFDKWIKSDLSWKAQPLYLWSRALQPFRVQEGDGNFFGDFRDLGVLSATLWCDRKPSWLLVVTEKHFFSPGPWDFFFLTQPMQFLAVHNASFSRCPSWLSAKVCTTVIYGFPTSFGKDHLCENIIFFSWVQDKSQRPLLLSDQELTTILQCADLLVTAFLCELAPCLWYGSYDFNQKIKNFCKLPWLPQDQRKLTDNVSSYTSKDFLLKTCRCESGEKYSLSWEFIPSPNVIDL